MKKHIKTNQIIKLINKFRSSKVIEFLLIFTSGVLLLVLPIFILFWLLSPILSFAKRSIEEIIAIACILNVTIIMALSIYKYYKYRAISKYDAIIVISSLTLGLLANIILNISVYCLLITFIIIFIMIFYKDLKSIIFVMNPIDSAINLEKKINFNGELISAVDFIVNERTYFHNKALEHLFIKDFSKKLITLKVRLRELINVKRIVYQLSFILMLLIILFIGEYIFAYKPSKFIKDVLSEEIITPISYDAYFNKTILSGTDFKFLTITNAEIISIELNYGQKSSIYNPREFKGSIAEIINQKDIQYIHYNSQNSNMQANENTKNVGNFGDVRSYLFVLENIEKDFTFRVRYSLSNNEVLLDEQKISIAYLPIVEQIKYTLKYPSEYGFDDFVSIGDGNIQTFVNSVVEIEIASNNELVNAYIVFKDENDNIEDKLMNINLKERHKASLVYKISSRKSYSIKLIDVNNNISEMKTIYTIDIIDDLPPFVELIEPKDNLIAQNMRSVFLSVRAEDDIAVKKLYVVYSVKNKERKLWSGTLPLKIKGDKIVNFNSNINFSKTGAKKGNIIDFYVKAVDSKGQTAKSNIISLTYPDKYDVFDSLSKIQKDEEKRLEELLEEQKSLDSEIKKLLQELNSKNSGETNINKIEELLNRQKELVRKSDEIRENIEQIKTLVKENELSTEANSKIDELSNLLEELNKSKVVDSIPKLEKILDDAISSTISKKDKIDEQKYIERLEKAIEKLRKLRDINKLIEAKEIVDDIIELQEKMNDDINQKDKTEEEKVNKLAELSRKTEEALLDINSDELIRKTKKLSESLKELNLKDVQEFKNKATSSKNKSEASLLGEKLEHNFKTIQQELDDLIKLSKKRDLAELINFISVLVEELIESTNLLSSIDKQILEFDEKFDNIKQREISTTIVDMLFIRDVIKSRKDKFNTLIEGIIVREKKEQLIALFNTIANYLETGAIDINNRRFLSIIRKQDYIRANLNHLTLEIIRLKTLLKNQISGNEGEEGEGSLSNGDNEEMNDLVEAQKRITSAVENFLGKNKDGNLSEEERKYLESIGEEQGEIGRRFEKQFGDLVSKDNKERLDEIQNIKKELDSIAKEIKDTHIGEDTVERQKKALERMIKSEKGITGDEYEKERKAEHSLNKILREHKQDELKNQLKKILDAQNMQKLVPENIEPEYIQFIIDYFARLKYSD